MSRLPTFVQKNPGIQEAIELKIVNVVDGIFLVAQLHLDSLVGKRSPKAIYTALNELEDQRSSKSKPTSALEAYDTAYDEAMSRIKGQVEDVRQLAEQVISWITLACRPLTTLEILHALAIEIGESEFDRTNISYVEDIVSACAGLVTIDDDSNVIRLVHYTTQEYFQRAQQHWFPDAQASIAIYCLTYLSFDDFAVGPSLTDDEFDARLEEFPLYDYAVKNWAHHARIASAGVENQILNFFKSKSKLSAFTQAMIIRTQRPLRARKDGYNYAQQAEMETSGMHVGAFFGLKGIVKALLDEYYDPDPRCSNGRTPLSFAAEKGHTEVVKQLLAIANVDPDSKAENSRYDDGRTPLSFAVERGHVEVINLLLGTRGVEINSKSSGKFSSKKTPLSFAAGRGHAEVVKQLLARDHIDAGTLDSHGRSPLTLAAYYGHTAIVQLLLANSNVDPDSMDADGWTPLMHAAANGHSGVIKELLDTGKVNPDSRITKGNFSGFTPLMWAAWGGYEQVVELLLATGKVGVNAKSEDRRPLGDTPLIIAAKRGQEAVVKILLQNGAVGVNLADGKGHTALDYALEKGYSSIVKLLQSAL